MMMVLLPMLMSLLLVMVVPMTVVMAAMATPAGLKTAVSAVMTQYSDASMMVSTRNVCAGSAGSSEPVAQDLSA